MNRVTFVLVHGAWSGGWSWKWVAEDLRERGHTVLTPTLTGLGERRHLGSADVDLDTHIDDVVNVLFYDDLTDVVLVGWSYGGTVITGVADRVPERIGQLIYLDADVPRDGESSVLPDRHAWYEEQAQLHGDGWSVPPFSISSVDDPGFEGVPHERRQWILERMAPHPIRSRLQPLRLSGAGGHIPTTFVRCTAWYDPNDAIAQREDARLRSEPDWRYKELPGTHLALYSIPEAVADVLVEVANEH
jgi:pimeloyl-ACP methyl ester carboxylesterase